MNIESSSNNISSKEYVSASLDKISQTKPGMVSSNLGNLKGISEQVQASTEGIISIDENVIQESSKSLKGSLNPPVESDDENEMLYGWDLEETYDADVEDVGEVDLEDEDLFGGLDEVENADIEEATDDIKEEETYIKEKATDIEEEAANVEEEKASVQEVISHEEEQIETQLEIEATDDKEAAKAEITEGVEEVSVGREGANRTQAEISVTSKDIKVSDVAIERVDTSIEQTKVSIDEEQSSIVKNQAAIAKEQRSIFKQETAIVKDSEVIREEKIARKENIEKLDRLNVTHQVNAELVDRSIDHVLGQEKFKNIYDRRGVPLRANERLKTELKDNITARREAEPDAQLSKIVKEEAHKWLVSKDLYERDDQGTLVRMSSERKRELANLFARGVVNQVIVEVAFSQKAAEANKKEDQSRESLRMSNRSENESVVYPIDGQKLDPKFFEATHKVVGCMLLCMLGIELHDVKRQEELKQEMIDLIDRIKQAVILKDALKREVLGKEVEHFETTHEMSVIDGERRGLTNKICRFDESPEDNICLRYPTLHPQVKA